MTRRPRRIRLMVVLLAAVVAGPWSLVDLALDSITVRAAWTEPAFATQAHLETGSTDRPRLRRPPPIARGWRIDPQAVVAEQDEQDDPAQNAPAGWWPPLRADGPRLPGSPAGPISTAASVNRRTPRTPIRVPLRC